MGSSDSGNGSLEESAITAAIVGELLPELYYAAPVLLERFDRGDPLVGTTSPTDLGFETGALDSVLLEFFKALVPYVHAAVGWGVLSTYQTWQLHKLGSRNQAQMVALLSRLLEDNANVKEVLGKIAELLARMDKGPVSVDEVVESIANAACRISPDEARPRA